MTDVDPKWDFFVSYTQADRPWAEWIAWVLEEDGYRVLVQAWDFVPGSNWTKSMQDGSSRAERTVAVLTEAYLHSVFGAAEWQAAWSHDPVGVQRKLLTVRVENCRRPGLLASVVGVDIFGLDEVTSKAQLRTAVAAAISGRAKPPIPPSFPGSGNERIDAGRAIPHQATYPGIEDE
jgi:TIR domain